jgi:hypothetical protein
MSRKVDQMQAARALLQPVLRHRGRVVGEHGRALHLALAQAHALAVFQVDRGNDQCRGIHGRSFRLFSS